MDSTFLRVFIARLCTVFESSFFFCEKTDFAAIDNHAAGSWHGVIL